MFPKGNLTNSSSLVIQANISYSANPATKLMYQTQAAVINGYANFTNLTISNSSKSIVVTFTSLVDFPFNNATQPFQVSKPAFKCTSYNQSIDVLVNSSFNMSFSMIDSKTNISVPPVVWTVSILISYFLQIF